MPFTAFIQQLTSTTTSMLDSIEDYESEDSTENEILTDIYLQLETILTSLQENL